MENPSLFDLIEMLEFEVSSGYKIIGKYVLIDYSNTKSTIDKLRKTFPQEVISHRIELYKSGFGKTFEYIDKIEELTERGFKLYKYTVIDIYEFHKLIDSIYAELPPMIQEARRLSNS